MKKNIKNYLFAFKILSGVVQSLLSFSFSFISFQVKKNLALMIAYSLIFTQIVIVYSYYNQTKTEQNNFFTIYNETINNEVNLNKINTIETFSTNTINCDHGIADEPINNSPSSRDFLINCAFKQLASGNKEQYLKNIVLAKQIDPNWIGWKK